MTLRNLIRRASRYKGRLVLASMLAVLGSGSMLAIPALAGALLGNAVSQDRLGGSSVVILLICALALTTAFTLLSSIVTVSASERVIADLRCEVHDHVMHLPLEFHDSSRLGDLIALSMHEVGILGRFLTGTLASLPAMVLTAIGATVMLFVIDPRLALVVPVLVPVFYITLKLLSRKLRGLAAEAREAEADVFATAESQLQMLLATKAAAAEAQQARQFARQVEVARRLRVRRDHASAALGPVAGFLAAVAAVVVVVAAQAQFAASAKSPQELFSFLLYAALLARPIGALSNVYGQWQMARGSLGRLERVFALAPEPGHAGTVRPGRLQGHIAFEQVDFSYPGRDGPVHGAELEIAPGEVVALVGENGCGKTTLVKLLLRLYELDAGRITVDGTDIADFDVRLLRRQIGYVPQRALLFNGTIRDNIAFGHDDVDPASIERATAMAQADGFIAALPQGLDTEIGDNGVRLSGGQRQRIALARALLDDPPMLILDEATSMWDLAGEVAFVASCRQALAGRTVIIVTHRPASLALADRVIMVEGGKCRELRDMAELEALRTAAYPAASQQDGS